MAAIYGIFQGNICTYIGQSIKPHRRARTHKYELQQAVTMRILEIVPYAERMRVENRWIRHFAEIGQAKMNFNGNVWTN